MITKEIIKKLCPQAKDTIVNDLVKYLNIYMPKYQVNTYLRVCHFLAQAAHESAHFTTLEEFASGAAYEGREDLGNIKKGDGVRYKGRGIFQLTGRANYKSIGAKLGYNLEGNPELAETPEISVLTALEYWNSRKISSLADKDDVLGVTKKINGGTNHLKERKDYLVKIKSILPHDFKFSVQAPVSPIVETPKLGEIVMAKIGDKSDYVKDLQEMLIRKGCKITADGHFGPLTEAAVKYFQKYNGLNITGRIDTDTLNKLMMP